MYPLVPPEALTVAAPVEPPKHATLVCEAAAALKAVAGWVMVTEAVVDPELASEIVTVYEPAVKPVAVAEFPPEGAQLYA